MVIQKYYQCIEIKWPLTNKKQVFKNPPIDINIRIKEEKGCE